MQKPFRAWGFFCAVVAMALAVPTTAQEPFGAATDSSGGRIAVLPFSNISGDPADDWIGAGIVETLMADLQGVDGVDLIGRHAISAAMRDTGTGDDAPTGDAGLLQLGRRVGARWLIGGGYQRLGADVRITARMVEVATGGVARSAKVDGASADLFSLQDQVVGQLVAGAAAIDVARVASAPSAVPAAPPAPVAPAPERAAAPALPEPVAPAGKRRGSMRPWC